MERSQLRDAETTVEEQKIIIVVNFLSIATRVRNTRTNIFSKTEFNSKVRFPYPYFLNHSSKEVTISKFRLKRRVLQ